MKIDRILRGLVSLGIVASLALPAVLAKRQTAPQAAHKEMGMHGGQQAAVESLKVLSTTGTTASIVAHPALH